LLLAFANECLDRMAAGAGRDHVEGLIHQHLLQMAGSVKPNASRTAPNEAGRSWEEVG
jgi:hypothetical protein